LGVIIFGKTGIQFSGQAFKGEATVPASFTG
jgi:hypothetical protein